MNAGKWMLDIAMAGLLAAVAGPGADKTTAAARPSLRWKNGPGNILSQAPRFYGGAEAARIARTVLLFQRSSGGWPKNRDMIRPLTDQAAAALRNRKNRTDTTFDNGATHTQARFLARVYNATKDRRCRDAVLRAVDFMLKAQYANGGWPQFFPLRGGYSDHITFNDNAMIGVMTALREVAEDPKTYAFVDEDRREKAVAALRKGIDCILRCQIVVNGRRTAWCAQHDQRTLAPRKARSYELPSISGSESVGIVRFLMSIEEPSSEIVKAVQGAVAWFDRAKLTGIRQVTEPDKSRPRGFDKIVVKDPTAPPMWARFYRIGTNKPIFCGRDGVPKDTLAEISYERRTGYSWLGYYPTNLLAKDYPAWQKKCAPKRNVLKRNEKAPRQVTSHPVGGRG